MLVPGGADSNTVPTQFAVSEYIKDFTGNRFVTEVAVENSGPLSVTGSAVLANGAWNFIKTLAIASATATSRGTMSAADKIKLDGIPPGGASTPDFSNVSITGGSISGVTFGAQYSTRLTVAGVVSGSTTTYTLNVTAGNEFVTAANIVGTTGINLSNLASIPTGAVWRGVLSFTYGSGATGVISWFSGQGTIRWDGGVAIVPTSGQTETVVITVVGGSSIIKVTALQGEG